MKKVKEEQVYDGFNKIVLKTFDDGTVREIKRSVDAAAVAIYNETGMVLVRQYRAAPEKWTLEIPAGMMDVTGENPIDCVIRETAEETGMVLDPSKAKKIIAYHPSIGDSEYKLHLFSIEIEPGRPILNDIDDADVVDVEFYTWQDIHRLIYNEGKITDGKTIMAYEYLKPNVNIWAAGVRRA